MMCITPLASLSHSWGHRAWHARAPRKHWLLLAHKLAPGEEYVHFVYLCGSLLPYMGRVCGTELRLWSLTTNASISKAPGKKMEAKLRDRAARGTLWELAEHPGDT